MIAAEVRLLTDDEALTAKPYHHVTLLVGGQQLGVVGGIDLERWKCGQRVGVGQEARD